MDLGVLRAHGERMGWLTEIPQQLQDAGCSGGYAIGTPADRGLQPGGCAPERAHGASCDGAQSQ
jgi:hypothetical protein